MAYFTAAEAQAFTIAGERPLADFTATELNEAAARVKESFEEICKVAFEPTTVTARLVDGSGSTDLLLPHTRVTSVSAATVGDTALTASELADLEVYEAGIVYHSGGWTLGRRNVSITYIHGWPTIPKRIKWAALVVAVKELTDSDLTSRMTSRSDDIGTTRFAPMGSEGNWYGIPAVDSILQQYSERVPAIG